VEDDAQLEEINGEIERGGGASLRYGGKCVGNSIDLKEQMHQGLADGIISERKKVLGAQQEIRKMFWSTIQTTGSGL